MGSDELGPDFWRTRAAVQRRRRSYRSKICAPASSRQPQRIGASRRWLGRLVELLCTWRDRDADRGDRDRLGGTGAERTGRVDRADGEQFYPPDVAESGVDLAALVVIRAPDRKRRVHARAERCLRSGAFGLVVLDLANGKAELSMQIQGRLVTARANARCRGRLVSPRRRKNTASIGSLISLRAEALRLRDKPAEFDVQVCAC